MSIVNDQFLKTVLESISEGVLVINRAFEIVYINDAITDLFGYLTEELVGHNMDILIPESIKKIHTQHLKGFYKKPSSKRMSERDDIYGVRKDGSLIGLDIGLNHFENKDEKFMIAVVSDISQTRMTNTFLKGLYAIMSNPKMILDAKIAAILELGCEKFHLPIGILTKVTGDEYNVSAIHAEEEIRQSIQALQSCKLEETYCFDVLQQEEPIHLANISSLEKKLHPWFSAIQLETYIGARVIVEDKIYGTIGFYSQQSNLVDITHTDLEILKLIGQWIGNMIQKENLLSTLSQFNTKLESKIESRTQELRHALIEIQEINLSLKEEVEKRIEAEKNVKESLEKEVKLNELKSRFVSTASHEFRTPLTGILSAANLIDRYAAAEFEEKRKKHIKIIKSSVKNLTNILNDFLSLSKLESGIVESDPISFELNSFIKGIIEDMNPTLKAGQKINFSPIQNDYQTVFQDSKLLKNVIINLLSNASKYSSEGKTIEVECQHDISTITISIKDKGIGIPIEDQQHLFDRFFRAGNASAYQGTGLGLNITRKHVDLMEGTITYESKENEGSTFKIKFPKDITVL